MKDPITGVNMRQEGIS